MTVRFLDEQPTPTAKGKVRFLDEAPATPKRAADPSLLDVVEKGPVRAAREMFEQDPTPSGAYRVTTVPSRKIGAAARAAVEKIPDPQTRSAVLNFILGTPETVGEIGADFAESTTTPVGVAAAVFPYGKVAGKAGELLRKNAPALSEALTGVRAKYFQRIANKPSTILPERLGGPKSLKAAGEAVGAEEKAAFGELAAPTAKEINDVQLTQARKNAIAAMNEIEAAAKAGGEDFVREWFSIPENGIKLLKGKRATEALLDSPSVTDKQRKLLVDQLQKISGYLENAYPALRKSLGDYGESLARSKGTDLLPVLRSGKPSFMRMALTLAGRGAGVPLGVTSPAVHGIGTAAASRLLAVAEKSTPQIRAAIMSFLAGENNGE